MSQGESRSRASWSPAGGQPRSVGPHLYVWSKPCIHFYLRPRHTHFKYNNKLFIGIDELDSITILGSHDVGIAQSVGFHVRVLFANATPAPPLTRGNCCMCPAEYTKQRRVTHSSSMGYIKYAHKESRSDVSLFSSPSSRW